MTLAVPGPGPQPANARLAGHLTDLLDRVHAAHARCAAPHDAGAVHDLRVACRRLDAALATWRDALRPRARRRLQRALRRLRRAAGPAREAEVQAARLARRSALEPTEAAATLERARRRFERRARDRRVTLARRAVPGLSRRLARALAGGPVPPDGAAAGVRLTRQADRARAGLLRALSGADDEAWHAARIALKRWRYAVESWEAVQDAGFGGAPSRRAFRAAQDALGALQDRVALRDALLALALRWIRDGHAARGAMLAVVVGHVEDERRAARAAAAQQARELLAAQ